MPDTRVALKNRLGELGLAPQREEEILRELSDHLADHAAALETGGMAGGAAFRQALNDVPDWLIGLLTYFVNWVLLPAVGLLIGSWPFLRRSQPHA